MGSGIAQVAAGTGRCIILYGLTEELVQKGFDAICRSLERAVDRGRIEARDAAATRARLEPTADLSRAGEVDFVIEAVIEDRELKRELSGELDAICSEEVIRFGGTYRLAEVVGTGCARELIMTGRRVDAQEALSIGMATEVVGADELMDRAMRLAKQIAAHRPEALANSERALNSMPGVKRDEAMELGPTFSDGPWPAGCRMRGSAPFSRSGRRSTEDSRS